MPLDYRLSTWPHLQAFLKVDEADVVLMEQFIDAATVRLEHSSGATFVQRDFSEYYRAGITTPQGRGRRLYLDHYPIVSVASIEDQQTIPATVDSADYEIHSDEGILEHHHVWPLPHYRWHVRYKAGRFATTDAVSEDVRTACHLLVKHWYQHGHSDTGVPLLSETIPTEVALLLSPYRSRGV